jgi:hypothetical protein
VARSAGMARKDGAKAMRRSGGRSIDAISGGENSPRKCSSSGGGSFLAFWAIVSNRCEYLWQFGWRTGDNEQDKLGTRRRGRRLDEDDRGSPNKRISLQVKNQGCPREQEGGRIVARNDGILHRRNRCKEILWLMDNPAGYVSVNRLTSRQVFFLNADYLT